jgi:hypothetical protein
MHAMLWELCGSQKELGKLESEEYSSKCKNLIPGREGSRAPGGGGSQVEEKSREMSNNFRQIAPYRIEKDKITRPSPL